MMKKTILLAALFTFIFSLGETQAQQFDQAIGARLGVPLSVSYKKFLNESNAVEVIGGFRGWGSGDSRYSYFTAAAAYQVHKPINIENVDGLSWYFGGGGAIFFWSFGNAFTEDQASTSFGIQGYLGLNYNFENTPINLTVDWVPTFLLNGYNNGFGADYGSFGIRYIIGR